MRDKSSFAEASEDKGEGSVNVECGNCGGFDRLTSGKRSACPTTSSCPSCTSW